MPGGVAELCLAAAEAAAEGPRRRSRLLPRKRHRRGGMNRRGQKGKGCNPGNGHDICTSKNARQANAEADEGGKRNDEQWEDIGVPMQRAIENLLRL